MAHRGQEVPLEPVHLVEVEVGLGQLVDLVVEHGVGLEQLFLRIDQPAEHAIEGETKFLELVGGVDVGPGVDVAPADLVADVPQMVERLHDHVPHDRVGHEHRQEDGDDGGRQQDGAVPVDRLPRGSIGHHHLHHRHQVFLGLAGVAGLVEAGRRIADQLLILMADETALPGPHGLVVVVFRGVFGAELAVLHRRFPGDGRRWRPVAKVVEHRRVEPLVAGPLLGGGIRVEQPPAVGLALERPTEGLDQARVLLFLLQGLPVVLEHDRVDEMPPRASRGGVDEPLRPAAVPPEAARDQHEQANPEQEAALPLQAGLAEDVRDRPVRHRVNRTLSAAPIGLPCHDGERAGGSGRTVGRGQDHSISTGSTSMIQATLSGVLSPAVARATSARRPAPSGPCT